MQKIVTDPLYIRCKKVLESCITKEQYNVALKYHGLAMKKNMPDIYDNLSNYTTYNIYWDTLAREVEWN